VFPSRSQSDDNENPHVVETIRATALASLLLHSLRLRQRRGSSQAFSDAPEKRSIVVCGMGLCIHKSRPVHGDDLIKFILPKRPGESRIILVFLVAAFKSIETRRK